ncbi:MAG: hypothetical protein IJ374_04365 [Lachnospiraceae bacterium]|nr:hypothetical protein [Lachnospiraceae bacterium]
MNNTIQNANFNGSNPTRPLEAALISIVNSIANEENALACILSAECAKINAVLANYDDIDTLLAIDTSVQVTLERITTLEGVLQAKLNAVLEVLADEN